MTMSYIEQYKEEWETEGFKGKTNIQICEVHHKKERIAIWHSITPKNRKYNGVLFFPSFSLIQKLIDVFVIVYGKAEVEKELGIKIK